MTVYTLLYIIMIWQSRNRNVYAAGTNGILNNQEHPRHVQIDSAAARTGINLTGGNLRSKAGPVPEHQAGKGATMNTPSKPPNSSLYDTQKLVNAFLDNCRLRHLSHETLRYYSDFLLKLGKQYPQLPDTPEPLEVFICHFQSSDARRHGAFRAVRAFYNWSERRYQITNPMKMVGAPRIRPKEMPVLTADQLKKLLEYPNHRPLVRVLLHFLADTGCRISEAANLESGDIFDDSVRVRGKTWERIIPISPMVHDMLLSLGPGMIFPHNSRTLSAYVCKAGSAAGVPCHAHDLRRTFATNWRGSDLSLKYIGGWKSWRMVEHYSQRRIEKARDDHRINSPIALIYGNDGNLKLSGPDTSPLAGITEYISKLAELAEALGAAKERIRHLEAELLLSQVNRGQGCEVQ